MGSILHSLRRGRFAALKPFGIFGAPREQDDLARRRHGDMDVRDKGLGAQTWTQAHSGLVSVYGASHNWFFSLRTR